MESLKTKTENLIAKLKTTASPSAQSALLSHYIADTLKQKEITLYEAYLLKAEAVSIQRKSYTQAAWNTPVSISILLEILNMRLLSQVLYDGCVEDYWYNHGLEAYRLNKEIRPHYIVDEYVRFLNGNNGEDYLRKLLRIRNKKRKDESMGPYHNELFPYDFCNYEELLLKGATVYMNKPSVSVDMEYLLVELYLMQE